MWLEPAAWHALGLGRFFGGGGRVGVVGAVVQSPCALHLRLRSVPKVRRPIRERGCGEGAVATETAEVLEERRDGSIKDSEYIF